jgi:hypothetical protein
MVDMAGMTGQDELVRGEHCNQTRHTEKSPTIAPLTSTSCGDIFRSGTVRQASLGANQCRTRGSGAETTFIRRTASHSPFH